MWGYLLNLQFWHFNTFYYLIFARNKLLICDFNIIFIYFVGIEKLKEMNKMHWSLDQEKGKVWNRPNRVEAQAKPGRPPCLSFLFFYFFPFHLLFFFGPAASPFCSPSFPCTGSVCNAHPFLSYFHLIGPCAMHMMQIHPSSLHLFFFISFSNCSQSRTRKQGMAGSSCSSPITHALPLHLPLSLLIHFSSSISSIHQF